MSEPMDTREEVELPALDVTEEELQLAQSKMIALWGVEGMTEQAIAYRNTYAEAFCRERQLKASLAANREQKAEIERLKAASVGEKPEDAWKRGYLAHARIYAADYGIYLDGIAIPPYIAPPTLPTEKEVPNER